MATGSNAWSDERVRNEIQRWRSYGYTSIEILFALANDIPDLSDVMSSSQKTMIVSEIEAGTL